MAFLHFLAHAGVGPAIESGAQFFVGVGHAGLSSVGFQPARFSFS
jgi:hypothetical protein